MKGVVSSWLPTGGYYLTSAYGAMSLIRNLQEEQAAQVLRTRNTLRQWHHRRTSQRSAPSVDDFQVRRRAQTSPNLGHVTHINTHVGHMMSQLSLVISWSKSVLKTIVFKNLSNDTYYTI